MKKLSIVLLICASIQPVFAAGNNYSEIERKEQQRIEQARRDHARSQQDIARFHRENQANWASFKNNSSSSSSSSKPGRMLDIKP